MNIGALCDQVTSEPPEASRADFHIKYTWTQKVTGVWPQEAQSIKEIAEIAHVSVEKLAGNPWGCSSTQYDADSTAKALAQDPYELRFSEKGAFEIGAACGSCQGTYTYGGEAFAVEMNSNWFSGCGTDSILKVFLEDLERARAAYIRDDRLIVTLANGAGTM